MAEAKKTQTLREQHPGAVPLTGGTGEIFKWDRVGAELSGRFLGLQEGSMGGKMVMLDDGKEIQVASAPTMLAAALDGVKRGTRVVIRYLGARQNKEGGTYKAFEAIAIPE
jgi:hypothetical protein